MGGKVIKISTRKLNILDIPFKVLLLFSVGLLIIFFGNQGGEMLMHPRSHPGKAKSYKPKALNETMLPMRRKKSLTISHNQHRTSSILTIPFQPKKRKEKNQKKNRSGHIVLTY